MRRDRFLEFLGHLARKGRAPNTQNNYRHAMMAFVKFCVDQSWLEENVLGTVPKTKVTLKPRQRRALSVEEFQRLTQLPKYGTVYLIAGLSGLRKKELRLLERRDIRPAEWRLRGEITKSKRAETVPMLPECWEILQPIWEQLSPLDKLVPKLPTHRVFDNDLKRADIAKRAEDGRQVDFHSLRYFFCTLCGRKLSIQLVRKLMRHRDIRTTCNLYMDLGIDDVLESIPELPRLFNKNGALQ
jgi:integrase